MIELGTTIIKFGFDLLVFFCDLLDENGLFLSKFLVFGEEFFFFVVCGVQVSIELLLVVDFGLCYVKLLSLL